MSQQDARSLRHVRWEYIALDHVLVEQWKKFAGRFPFDKQFVLDRIRNYRTNQIQYLAYPKEKKSHLDKLDSFLKGHLIDLPIPEGIHGEYIFDFNANQLYVNGKKSVRVCDPDSPAGIAVLLTSSDGYFVHNGKRLNSINCHSPPVYIMIFRIAAARRFDWMARKFRKMKNITCTKWENIHL